MNTSLKKWIQDDLDQLVRYANNKNIWDQFKLLWSDKIV